MSLEVKLDKLVEELQNAQSKRERRQLQVKIDKLERKLECSYNKVLNSTDYCAAELWQCGLLSDDQIGLHNDEMAELFPLEPELCSETLNQLMHSAQDRL